MPILEVQELRARYTSAGPEILKGISFDVEADDFFAIIGPSGAGQVDAHPLHQQAGGAERRERCASRAWR